MKPEFKLGCHTCSAQLRGSREKNPLCWALLNHSSVLITMIPFKPLAKLPNKPPFVTWVSSKKQIKKKACIRLLLKNLSAPISLTRLHSQRACQLARDAFLSLGTASAGLGSNEKREKKATNKYTEQNLY